MVPYVDAVVAMTVMCVLLFVLHVCMLRECKGTSVMAMLVLGMEDVCDCGEYMACGWYTWFRYCV